MIIKNKNILICYLSCKKNDNLWENLLNKHTNSIIFYGNPNLEKNFTYKNRILTLKCEDTYDYLPVKIFLMIKYILKIQEFENITHIFKVDDYDTNVDKNINNKLNTIKLHDFCGQIIYKN